MKILKPVGLAFRYIFGLIFWAFGLLYSIESVTKPWGMSWLNIWGKLIVLGIYAISGTVCILIGRHIWPHKPGPPIITHEAPASSISRFRLPQKGDPPEGFG
jgi:hypothetical protein